MRRGDGPILILSTCPEAWGGSEEIWAAAARALLARGERVHVRKTAFDPGHPKLMELAREGIDVGPLDPDPRSIRWAGLGALTARAYPLDTDRRRAFRAAAVAARLRPKIALVSQGGNVDGGSTGEALRRIRVPYAMLSTKASELEWPADHVLDYLARVYREARCSFFVSRHNLHLTERRLRTELTNGDVVPVPLRLTNESPLSWPEGDRDVVRMACVARLFPLEKGQDLLVDVLDSEPWRRREYLLTLAGSGANEVGVRDLAERLGSSCVMAGQINDIAGLWAENHLLVLPSRAEGTPLSLLEAMWCGRPSVVTDVGGNAELAGDGVAGFVAREPSREAISEALERAWERREQWPAIGQAAAARAQDYASREAGEVLADRLLAAGRA